MRGRRCPGCLMVRARGLGGRRSLRAECRAPTAHPCHGTPALVRPPPWALHSTTLSCVSRPSMGRETRAKVVHAFLSAIIPPALIAWYPLGGEALVLDDALPVLVIGPEPESVALLPPLRRGQSAPECPSPARCRNDVDTPQHPLRKHDLPIRPHLRPRCPKRRVLARTSHSVKSKAPGHRMVSWRYLGRRGFNPLRFGHIRPGNPINRPRVRTGPPRRRRPMACGA